MKSAIEPTRTEERSMANKKTQEKLAAAVKAQSGVKAEAKALAQEVKQVVATADAAEKQALADAEKQAKKAALRKSRDEKAEALEEARRALLAEARKAGMQLSEAGNVWRVKSAKSKLWMSYTRRLVVARRSAHRVGDPPGA